MNNELNVDKLKYILLFPIPALHTNYAISNNLLHFLTRIKDFALIYVHEVICVLINIIKTTQFNLNIIASFFQVSYSDWR